MHYYPRPSLFTMWYRTRGEVDSPRLLFLLCIATVVISSCRSTEPLAPSSEQRGGELPPKALARPVWGFWADSELQRILVEIALPAPDSIRRKAVATASGDVFIGDFAELAFETERLLRVSAPRLDSVSGVIVQSYQDLDSLHRAHYLRALDSAGGGLTTRFSDLLDRTARLLSSLDTTLQGLYRSPTWTAESAAAAGTYHAKVVALLQLTEVLSRYAFTEWVKRFERQLLVSPISPDALRASASGFLTSLFRQHRVQSLRWMAVAADLETQATLQMPSGSRRAPAKGGVAYWRRDGASYYGGISSSLSQISSRLEAEAVRLKLFIE